MTGLSGLKVKVFADGADVEGVRALAAHPLVRGFTTNPTLMRKAGVDDYVAFAREVLRIVPDRSVSFEVFADDFATMEAQALELASWGPNVFVKIPVTDTRGVPSHELLRRLSAAGVRVNVTAVLTLRQVREAAAALAQATHGYVSVFAGRIADTGHDPVPLMAEAVDILRPHPHLELLWASPRELLNIFQADAIGCHIITVAHELLGKLELVGKDLDEYSLETVRMFHRDAVAAGYALPLRTTATGAVRWR